MKENRQDFWSLYIDGVLEEDFHIEEEAEEAYALAKETHKAVELHAISVFTNKYVKTKWKKIYVNGKEYDECLRNLNQLSGSLKS